MARELTVLMAQGIQGMPWLAPLCKPPSATSAPGNAPSPRPRDLAHKRSASKSASSAGQPSLGTLRQTHQHVKRCEFNVKNVKKNQTQN